MLLQLPQLTWLRKTLAKLGLAFSSLGLTVLVVSTLTTNCMDTLLYLSFQKHLTFDSAENTALLYVLKIKSLFLLLEIHDDAKHMLVF